MSGLKILSYAQKILEKPLFLKVVMALIVFNAAILGLETYPYFIKSYGTLLKTADHLILWLFLGEISLRLLVYRKDFLKNPWSVFDLIVILISFLPDNEIFSVLRVARALRVLRLISVLPQLRKVIEGFISSIPAIGSIGVILIVIMYVFSVIATKLYGTDFPQFFGSLQSSAFSLFQIMTLEGWPDIVRSVMAIYPYAWLFFIICILIATFSVLNLFIAVVVDSMQRQNNNHESEEAQTLKSIQAGLKELQNKIDQLKK